MRVAKLRSISAKLFYMTTSLVVMTVVGNSWQNAVMFNGQVERQVQEGTFDLAKERASAIEGTLDNWRTEVALVVNAALGAGKPAEQLRAMEGFLAVNPETVALQLFKEDKRRRRIEPGLFSFTKSASTARFEGMDAAKAQLAIRKSLPNLVQSRALDAKGDRVQIASAAGLAKLPMLLLLFPYRVDDGNEQHWAALVLWTSRLVAAMPSSELTRSRLTAIDGQILAAPPRDEQSLGVPATSDLALAEILKAGGPTGLQTYKDTLGEEWLLAFARLAGYDAAIVIERSARAQQLATDQIIRRSALWGWAFVLIAILVSYFGAGGMTAQLRSLTRATSEIAAGNLQAKVPTKGRDEVTLLGASVSNMAQRIEVLLHEQVAKAEMQKELETAQAVQRALFPKLKHVSPAMTTKGFYQPATQCGGDWWGSYHCQDGSELLFIGDATGHGAGPALVTAMAYTSCQTIPALLETISRQGELSPAALLARINQLIFDAINGEIAMTFFVALVDPTRRRIRYANAGHNFPLLFRKAELQTGAPPSEPTYKQLTLKGGGTPLGYLRESNYEDSELEFGDGDYLVLYTDGLIECVNAEGRAWGKRSLFHSTRRALGQGAEKVMQAIRDEALTYFGATPLADDITIVVTELHPSAARAAGSDAA